MLPLLPGLGLAMRRHQGGAPDTLGVEPHGQRARGGVGDVIERRIAVPQCFDNLIHQCWVDQRAIGGQAHDEIGARHFRRFGIA